MTLQLNTYLQDKILSCQEKTTLTISFELLYNVFFHSTPPKLYITVHTYGANSNRIQPI